MTRPHVQTVIIVFLLMRTMGNVISRMSRGLSIYMIIPKIAQQGKNPKRRNKMRGLFWRVFIIRLCLRWCWKICVGDQVWYREKKYLVANGARFHSWRLRGLWNERDGWVSRENCRKVKTPKNAWGSFRRGYRFYMSNWYQIWVSQGIEPWMRRCNIWGKK